MDPEEILVYCKFNDAMILLLCPIGFSLMQCLKSEINNQRIIAITENILATCGGNMSCSTCMVKIDSHWIHKLTPPTENENIFIDMFLDQYNIYDYEEGEYRLSCQIPITKELNNLIIILVANY